LQIVHGQIVMAVHHSLLTQSKSSSDGRTTECIRRFFGAVFFNTPERLRAGSKEIPTFRLLTG
jgi:hypothetical protein